MIQLENVSVGQAHDWRLHQINLTIKDGEKVGIIGLSGSGKTTLGEVLVGLRHPSKGEIQNDFQIRLPIFQHANQAFNPKQTLGEAIKETFHLRPEAKTYLQARCDRYVQAFGLSTELYERYPREVSGGQLQRLNVIRTLMVQPDMTVCDEITSNVDVLVEHEMVQQLNQYHAETGKTLVMISHDIAFLSQCVDRFIVLEDGECVDDFLKEEMFEPERRIATQRLIEVYQ